MSVIEAVTVTLYRVKAEHRPKGWRKGKPRRSRALAYRDAAWAKLRVRCRCVLPDVFDPEDVREKKLCRYHDKAFRATPGRVDHETGPEPDSFIPPSIWGLPRADEDGFWDYGRAVAYRLARLYAHLDRARPGARRTRTP